MSTGLMIITFMVGVPTHIHNHTDLQVESLVCYILMLWIVKMEILYGKVMDQAPYTRVSIQEMS